MPPLELTYGDWNTDTATSSNVDVQGDTFTLAEAILWKRSFETGDLSNWTGDTADYTVTQTPTPQDGSFICEAIHPASNAGFFIDSTVPDTQPSNITVYLRVDTDNSNEVHGVRFQDSSGTTGFGFQIGSFGSGLDYGGFRTSTTNIGGLTAGTWYKCEARNIDWVNHVLDVYVDGVQELSGVAFSGSNISSIANIEMEHNSSSGTAFSAFIDGNIAI